MNGGEFWSTGANPMISRTIGYPERETITVRVTNDIGDVAESTTKVVTHEGDWTDNTMTPPRNVTAECTANGEIIVSRPAGKPNRAKHLLFRLNDVDLDYIPATELSATITDIDNVSEISSLKVAWLDEDYELGNWAEVALDCPESININPVETGISATCSALWMIAVVAACVIFAHKKYLPH